MRTYQELLKQYLDYTKANQFVGAPDELYAPANYILGLGGKRIRPLLSLLGYNLAHTEVEKALPLAHAVEVFHNFTLMHDDIMDNASVRRGDPTVHVKWDTNIAILSGDMMLVKAYQLLNSLDVDLNIKSKIVDAFGEMAEAVCIGQQYDMNFETMSLVTEEQYLGMIEGKTSVLLAFSLQAGAMLAGVKSNITKALYAYGLNTGLAFQVMDDYLDTFGSQASFGKRIGGDILENKKTLLWIEAQKRCSTSQLETLQHWYKQDVDSDDKIKAVTALFKALEIDKYTKSKVDYYFNEASKNLSAIKESYNTEALEALGTDLNVRNT